MTFIIISLTLADFILSFFAVISILVLIDSIIFLISAIIVLFCLIKNKNINTCLKKLILIFSIIGLILRYIGNLLRTDIIDRKNIDLSYSIIYLNFAYVLFRISYLVFFCPCR